MEEIIDLSNAQRLIGNWARARLIIQNGNQTTQFAKLVSEYGELNFNLAKFESIKDDVGDCFVVCAILAEMNEIDLMEEINNGLTTEDEWKYPAVAMASRHLGLLGDNVIKGQDIAYNLSSFMRQVIRIASAREVVLEDAIAFAYSEIKDRKGTTLPNGTFVKEESNA